MAKYSPAVKLPQNPAEYSTNWKNLLTKLNDEKKKSTEKGEKASIKQVLISKNTRINNGLTKKKKFKKATSVKSEMIIDEHSEKPSTSSKDSTVNKTFSSSDLHLSKCLAMDCEFVGVGEDGFDDMVARVSIVNYDGVCVYDKFVKPKENVVDYRTRVSGVRPEDLENAEPLETIQKEVTRMIDGRTLVGHGIKKDLQVLFLCHPKKNFRDTSKYAPFRATAKTNRPSLKKLAALILGVAIQQGEHDSVTDARVAMQLYRTRRREWEASLRSRRPTKKQNKNKPSTNSSKKNV